MVQSSEDEPPTKPINTHHMYYRALQSCIDVDHKVGASKNWNNVLYTQNATKRVQKDTCKSFT